MDFKEAYVLQKKLWEEAEKEHAADDEVLTIIYKRSSDILILAAIEKRWSEQGGKYWDGKYYSFEMFHTPRHSSAN